MIAAFTVGKYSEASVLMVCSTMTAATSRRYGRTYRRTSARSMSLLSHTDPRPKTPVQPVCRQFFQPLPLQYML